MVSWASKASLLTSLSLMVGVAQGAESPKKTDEQAKPEQAKPEQAKAEQARPAQPDIKFLEYLGTLEGDGENWTEIAAVALAAPASKPAAKPEAVAKPAETK